MAIIARMTLSLLEVLGRDYIRTARAKGCPGGPSCCVCHEERLLPVVTTIGLSLATSWAVPS